VHIPVHRHTLRVITRLQGAPHLIIDQASPLLPLLITRPCIRKVPLRDTIAISGPSQIVLAIREDAGHALYRHHMTQLLDWITLHVSMGQQGWTAMMDYYRAVGLDIDDLDPGSVYRQWYRLAQRKKSTSGLYNPASDVPKNITPLSGTLSAVMMTTAELIERHPDAFYLRSGLPDPQRIRQAMLYAMAVVHGWSQIDIADRFEITQPAVSKSLKRLMRSQSPVLS
jgi:hypothetical protein